MLAAYVNSIANMAGSKHWKPSPPEVIQQISQALLHDLLFSGASPKEVNIMPVLDFAFDRISCCRQKYMEAKLRRFVYKNSRST